MPSVGAAAPATGSIVQPFSPQQSVNTARYGYNQAIGNLQNSLNASNNTTSGAQMQLGTQLQQNQGQVSQNLANRGLGNTTVSQTMAQAPLQTYNQGMLNVQNAGAERQMQAYGSLANMNASAGQSLANMQAPYAQFGNQQQYQQNQGISPLQQQQTANNAATQQSFANAAAQANNANTGTSSGQAMYNQNNAPVTGGSTQTGTGSASATGPMLDANGNVIAQGTGLPSASNPGAMSYPNLINALANQGS